MKQTDYDKIAKMKNDFLKKLKKEFNELNIKLDISVHNLDIENEIWETQTPEATIGKSSIWFTNACFSEINLYSKHFNKPHKDEN